MAKRSAVQYVCNSCGNVSSSFSGKCFNCGEWNTLEEQLSVYASASVTKKGHKLSAQSLSSAVKQDMKRIKSGLIDVDHVLGGGLVAGSVNLIAGQPGIGKSTLLLQIAQLMSENSRVLYVSGEESLHQI